MIKVSKNRYAKLLKAEYILSCLEAAGVDNWEWYSEAMSNKEESNISASDVANEMTDDEIINYLG